MRLTIALVFILALCWLSSVQADEAGTPVTGEAKAAFLTTWGERLRHMRTLHMVFTQEKHLPVLRQPLMTQGELWLQGERLLYNLKSPTGDTELVVALDKQRLRTYYPLLHTLEVLELQNAGALPQAFPLWYADPEALQKDYTVDLWHDSTGLDTLRLVPRDANSPLQDLRLELRAFQPQVMVQVEKGGTRVRLQITVFTVNPEVTEAQLELRVPAGTKIVQLLK